MQTKEVNDLPNDQNSKHFSEEMSSGSEDENQNADQHGNNDNFANQQRRKRERRSKEDGSLRNYVCGCSKSYLSYAAI